jgi:hypothetical protein
MNALLVDAEERKLFGVGEEDAGAVQGGVDAGVFGSLVRRGGFVVAERKNVAFNRGYAIEPPVVVGDGLGDLRFENADRAKTA